MAVTLRTLSGAAPQWGVAAADVLVEGVTEGTTASLMALYANVDAISKAGPVGPGRDLLLQFALPLNALPVHIDKNIYASNLLNALGYQDLDGYHIGKAAFAFDQDRQNAGYREENCWYTTADLIRAGLEQYGASLEGENTPLFLFGERAPVAGDARNATSLTVTFTPDDSEQLNFDAASGLYYKTNADGSPATDADNGQQAAFTNVFVLYASSGIKDDGYTRDYDMTGGTGLYLTGGAWEAITWAKEDATGPLQLTAADGQPLVVSPGKSFIALWGGYYGQALRLTGADGAEQALPEKPALLESGISDEAAAAAPGGVRGAAEDHRRAAGGSRRHRPAGGRPGRAGRGPGGARRGQRQRRPHRAARRSPGGAGCAEPDHRRQPGHPGRRGRHGHAHPHTRGVSPALWEKSRRT